MKQTERIKKLLKAPLSSYQINKIEEVSKMTLFDLEENGVSESWRGILLIFKESLELEDYETLAGIKKGFKLYTDKYEKNDI